MDTARVQNPIFEDLSTLADATRSRMLLLLERHELTVSELVRRAPAAAIDGQPAPENAGRCELGRIPPRRHEPVLHAGARRARPADPAAMGAASRAGGRDRGRGSGCVAAEGRPRRGADRSPRNSSIRPRASGTSCVRICSGRPRSCRRFPRCSTIAGSSAISAAGPARSAAALAPFVARVIAVDRSRRNAAGGEAAAARSAERRRSSAANSSRCRSPTRSSMPPR